MLKSIFQAIRQLSLIVAGGAGGLLVGGILSMLLLHLKTAHGLEIPLLGQKVLITLLASIAAGMFAPRFFMMFFLCPISWLLNSDSSGEGHPLGGDDVTWPNFLLNVSYMTGVVAFGSGVMFSLPWIAGSGLLGIAVFSVGVFQSGRRRKREQAANGDRR